jgi:tRNA modification GTPase
LGVARTWQAIERADALLLVVDARTGVTSADRAIVARLPRHLRPLTVFNKVDLAVEIPSGAQSSEGAHVRLSAKTGEGMDELRRALLALAGWQSGVEDVFMARARHLGALERVAEALERAGGAMLQSELFAEELRLAHSELGTITGEFATEDLLGEIFSRFCIGK